MEPLIYPTNFAPQVVNPGWQMLPDYLTQQQMSQFGARVPAAFNTDPALPGNVPRGTSTGSPQTGSFKPYPGTSPLPPDPVPTTTGAAQVARGGARGGALANVSRAAVNPTTAKVAGGLGGLAVGAVGADAWNEALHPTDLDTLYPRVTGYRRPDDAGFWSDLGVRAAGEAENVGNSILSLPGQTLDMVKSIPGLVERGWNAWNGVLPAKSPEEMAAERAARGTPGLPTTPPSFEVAGEPPGGVPGAPGALPGGQSGGMGGRASVRAGAGPVSVPPAQPGAPGSPGAFGDLDGLIQSALGASPEQQKAATAALEKSLGDVDTAFAELAKRTGVPEEVSRGLDRHEKGMLLLQFGLAMAGAAGRPGVNGLSAAAFGGQTALAGYGDIIAKREGRAKDLAMAEREGALQNVGLKKWKSERAEAGVKQQADTANNAMTQLLNRYKAGTDAYQAQTQASHYANMDESTRLQAQAALENAAAARARAGSYDWYVRNKAGSEGGGNGFFNPGKAYQHGVDEAMDPEGIATALEQAVLGADAAGVNLEQDGFKYDIEPPSAQNPRGKKTIIAPNGQQIVVPMY